jgi:dCMP deaminase
VGRKSWESYFLQIAEVVSDRGTCDRRKVGVVLVKDNRIVATGYNGSIVGEAHCDEVGHLMEDGHCIRTVHAEMNAVAQAAKYGISLDGSVAFITDFPCWNCFKVLVNAGVTSIYYAKNYRVSKHVVEAAARKGISICQVVPLEETDVFVSVTSVS